jgi:hypothetical protein
VSGRPNRTGGRAAWWLPSVGAAIWLAAFLALSLSGWRNLAISADGDPCLHRRLGGWMLEQRAVLRQDVLSHTRPGAPVITKEWLSQTLLAAAANALDWNGTVLVATLSIATCLWLLYRQLRQEDNDLLLSAAMTLAAGMAASVHWLARPHLFTHLLTLVFAWRLRAFDRGRADAKQLLLTLTPLMALWANLHGAFPNGLVLIGLYLAGNAIGWRRAAPQERAAAMRKLKSLAALLAACGLATLVNPNGWHLHAIIFGYLKPGSLAGMVNEFASPNFHLPEMRGFLLMLLLLGVLLLAARPVLPPVEVLLLAAWGWFALHSVRNVPIFALVAAPILAGHFNRVLADAPAGPLLEAYRRLSARLRAMDGTADGRALVAAAVLGVTLAAAKPVLAGGAPLLPTGILASEFPVAAVAWLREEGDGLSGEMFSTDVWGSYVAWAAPERRVFMDSRHEFYGIELINDYYEITSLGPRWRETLEQYRIGWTLLPAAHALNQALELSPHWSCVYRDAVAAVYHRAP